MEDNISFPDLKLFTKNNLKQSRNKYKSSDKRISVSSKNSSNYHDEFKKRIQYLK